MTVKRLIHLLVPGLIAAVTIFAGCRTRLVDASRMEDAARLPADVALPVDADAFRHRFNAIEQEKLSLSIAYFQELVEWALVLRGQTVAFADELESRKSMGLPLSGYDLERFNLGLRQHLGLRQEVLSLVYTYRDQLYHPDRHPWLLEERFAVKATALTSAASLLLYDNFAIAMAAFQESPFLRRLANRGDAGYDLDPDILREIVNSYHSPAKRQELRQALEWLVRMEDTIEQGVDPELDYLRSLIQQSFSRQTIGSGDPLFDSSRYMKLIATHGQDRLHDMSLASVNRVSRRFGNTVGLVEFRKGKLLRDTELIARLKQELRPLDILLEKTPFRLTDKLIPGHFGHVALWVGTETELKAAGLWDHPLIVPHQAKIADGHGVLEALREGVVLRRLEEFMNVDDLAVVRRRHHDPTQTAAMLLRAFRQVGKEYDFNFDVETPDRIVCSELIYAVYTDLAWPTEKVLGRATISPDNVAIMALADQPLELVLFYHDGNEVEPRHERFAGLAGADLTPRPLSSSSTSR